LKKNIQDIKDIIKGKVEAPAVLVVTTGSVPGSTVDKALGIVNGHAVVGTNLLRGMESWMRDVVGGRSIPYEDLLRYTYDTAIREMSLKAKEMGADAVIGTTISFRIIENSLSKVASLSSPSVTATGTAVTLTAKCKEAGKNLLNSDEIV
jgi:uncharacterized protein YbjQ (UPF0145 family)